MHLQNYLVGSDSAALSKLPT